MTEELVRREFGLSAVVDKPPMEEWVRPFVDKARKRHMRRPLHPGVLIEKVGNQEWTFGSVHSDLDAWQVQIFDAFGTRSMGACLTFLHQLAALCYGEPDYGPKGWAPNEAELNAALSIVHGMKPRNEVQAALAAQMVAIHVMTMRLTAHSLRHGTVDAQSMAIAGRLARTFPQQAEAMARLQGRTGRQRITVKNERHIHHHEHKHLHAESGGGLQIRNRPYEPNTCANGAPAIEHEACAALPSPDKAGNALPMPSDAREG